MGKEHLSNYGLDSKNITANKIPQKPEYMMPSPPIINFVKIGVVLLWYINLVANFYSKVNYNTSVKIKAEKIIYNNSSTCKLST